MLLESLSNEIVLMVILQIDIYVGCGTFREKKSEGLNLFVFLWKCPESRNCHLGASCYRCKYGTLINRYCLIPFRLSFLFFFSSTAATCFLRSRSRNKLDFGSFSSLFLSLLHLFSLNFREVLVVRLFSPLVRVVQFLKFQKNNLTLGMSDLNVIMYLQQGSWCLFLLYPNGQSAFRKCWDSGTAFSAVC